METIIDAILAGWLKEAKSEKTSIFDSEYDVETLTNGDIIFHKRKSIKNEPYYQEFQKRLKEIDDTILQEALEVLYDTDREAYITLNDKDYAKVEEFNAAKDKFESIVKDVVNSKVETYNKKIAEIQKSIDNLKDTYSL